MANNESSTPDLEAIRYTATCASCQALNDIVRYCVTCLEDSCITCTNTSHEYHKILPREHSIVKYIKFFSSDTCNSHKDEKLSMFCVTCKTPCCISCIDENHDGHPMSTMKSIAKKADSMYATLVDKIPQSKSEYNNTKTGYDNYMKSMDSTISGIKGQFERLRLTFEEMEVKMLEPLVKEVDEVKRMYSEYGQSLMEAECLIHLYESAQEEIQIQKVVLFSNCQIFEDLKLENVSFPEPVSFEPSSFIIPKAEEIIGCVHGKRCKYLEKEEECEENPVRLVHLKCLDVKCLEGRVIPTLDDKSWIISNEKKDSVYDFSLNKFVPRTTLILSTLSKDLKHKIVVDLKESKAQIKITDVALFPPSDLLFTDTNAKKIWRVSESGKLHLVLDTALVSPNGICITSDKNLVLGLKEKTENGRSLIRIYSFDDLNVIDEIEKDDQGKPFFSSIKSIVDNCHEDLIVHDGDHLLCISNLHSLKFRIKKDFYQFCIDKFCNIVIATENEIRVLDEKGNYIKTLLTKFDFLTKPTSLSIDGEGLLWIGQANNAKVVKYLK